MLYWFQLNYPKSQVVHEQKPVYRSSNQRMLYLLSRLNISPLDQWSGQAPPPQGNTKKGKLKLMLMSYLSLLIEKLF